MKAGGSGYNIESYISDLWIGGEHPSMGFTGRRVSMIQLTRYFAPIRVPLTPKFIQVPSIEQGGALSLINALLL